MGRLVARKTCVLAHHKVTICVPEFRLICLHRWMLLCIALAISINSYSAPRINEFLADNDTGLKDQDGEYSDWIEIFNPDDVAVNLRGYHLTDNPENLNKWTFPAVTLAAKGYLVVFASNKNRNNPTNQLHTDFSLDADGEFLALVAPDGTNILTSFGPVYPQQHPNISYGLSGGATPVISFFTPPTPGATNAVGTRAGPGVRVVTRNPPQPVSGDLKVSARVWAVNDPVGAVNLYYRRMFGTETNVVMRDDGTGGDSVVGDGIFTATIPEAAFIPGDMTRWRVSATDSRATETKDPAYRSTTDSHQYFGTVPPDPTTQTLLPVLHWFIQNPNGAAAGTGARGALYYNGEFYDNVFFNIHGQSSSGFPKKSYNVNMNRTQRFRWTTNAPPAKKFNLLSNWADKSKSRHVLAYEIMRKSGVPAHFAFTVRVEQNGNFFSTADIVEDGDDVYLERAGLNKEGALYKVYSNTLSPGSGTGGVEKKNRETESTADLQALINGLGLTGTNQTRFIFDNIDIPRLVNMLAANSVIRNIDMHSKNWYIYRDTGRSGEWTILPWDLDLSQGRVWNTQNTYFDNALYFDGFVQTGTAVYLVDRMFANPQTRAMIMRRVRTLSDRFLQPPPSAGSDENTRYYERRLSEIMALIDPPSIVPSDAQRDFMKWGSWLQAGTTVSYTNTNVAVESMAEAVGRFKNEYLPARRNFIYNTQIVGRGGEIPLSQDTTTTYSYTPLVTAGAPVKAFVPVDNTLGVNWIGIPAQEPYNTANWLSGTTGVGYERATGYESLIGLNLNEAMRSNNTVFLRIEFNVENPAVFDRLELRMKFDDGFVAYLNGAVLVASNSPATPTWSSASTLGHEANPAAFDIIDVTSKKSNLRVGRNILALRGLNDTTNSSDFLILPELYGARINSTTVLQPTINFGAFEVSPVSGNQDQEYIQLVNPNSIAVDISDWKLSGGVEHTFIGGTVIPANGSLYVTPNSAAFRARKTAPMGGQTLFVQGGYSGHLSNIGETIWLLDDRGFTNNVLTYPGQPSDLQRYLVVSEFMYRPPGDGLAEYIELQNVSSETALDLNGVRFSAGIDFNFTNSTVKTLAPGGRLVIVRDVAAFQKVYGTAIQIAGVFENDSALSNGGEKIKIEDADNLTIREFVFDDVAPWPLGTDGTGRSVVLIQPETNPNHANPANWRASALPTGNPGGSDRVPLPANYLADDNGNGEPNLIDYAFGTALGTPIWPSITQQTDPGGGPNIMRFTYAVSVAADQVIVEPLYSKDLETWADANDSLEPAVRQMMGDGRALVSRRIKPELLSEGSVYLRVRVTPRP